MHHRLEGWEGCYQADCHSQGRYIFCVFSPHFFSQVLLKGNRPREKRGGGAKVFLRWANASVLRRWALFCSCNKPPCFQNKSFSGRKSQKPREFRSHWEKLYITQIIATKLLAIWFVMFIADPGSDFFLIPYSGSRILCKKHRIPDSDRQRRLYQGQISVLFCLCLTVSRKITVDQYLAETNYQRWRLLSFLLVI